MDISTLILEFLKVLLTGPVIAGAIGLTFILMFREPLRSLISRIASIKLPGGGELHAPQQPPAKEDTEKVAELPTSSAEQPLLPAALTDEQLRVIRELIDSERARAYLWEYRFLNLFLVPNTTKVLEWFASLQQRVTHAMYDTLWSSSIADATQRQTILSVLESHHLVQRDENLLEITPKGREYLQWKDKI